MAYLDQWKVESESQPGRNYTVSEHADHVFACSCVGWTRHVPRRDCKHIRWVKAFGPLPVDPLLRAVEKAQHAATRKEKL